MHARRAVGSYIGGDVELLHTGSISVGVALELLAKAVLVHHAPGLLAGRPDVNSLLTLLGRADRAVVPTLEISTIDARAALKAVKHLLPATPWLENQSQHALIVRNAALHLGLVDLARLREAIAQQATIAAFWLNELEIEPAKYWSEQLETVTAIVDMAATATQRVVKAKIEAARVAYEKSYGHLDPATKEVLLAWAQARPIWSSDHDEPATCPACGAEGWLSCSVERGETEFDTDEDGTTAWTDRTAYPDAFRCSVCKLELEGNELDGFSFPDAISLDPEPADPADLYDYDEDGDALYGR